MGTEAEAHVSAPEQESLSGPATLVLAKVGEAPVAVDDLIEASGLPAENVFATIGELELAAAVRSRGGFVTVRFCEG
jgi:predicted Rossmann fold nucleotide-binding protein DprA/Smf involved in DNA uptake